MWHSATQCSPPVNLPWQAHRPSALRRIEHCGIFCNRKCRLRCNEAQGLGSEETAAGGQGAHNSGRAGSRTFSTQSTAMGDSRLQYCDTTLLLSDLRAGT